MIATLDALLGMKSSSKQTLHNIRRRVTPGPRYTTSVGKLTAKPPLAVVRRGAEPVATAALLMYGTQHARENNPPFVIGGGNCYVNCKENDRSVEADPGVDLNRH